MLFVLIQQHFLQCYHWHIVLQTSCSTSFQWCFIRLALGSVRAFSGTKSKLTQHSDYSMTYHFVRLKTFCTSTQRKPAVCQEISLPSLLHHHHYLTRWPYFDSPAICCCSPSASELNERYDVRCSSAHKRCEAVLCAYL